MFHSISEYLSFSFLYILEGIQKLPPERMEVCHTVAWIDYSNIFFHDKNQGNENLSNITFP